MDSNTPQNLGRPASELGSVPAANSSADSLIDRHKRHWSQDGGRYRPVSHVTAYGRPNRHIRAGDRGDV